MKVIRRDPDKGYIDSMMWVPKMHINVEGVKNALTFEIPDKDDVRYLTMWSETSTHLIVPRSFWDPRDLPITFIDCRPKGYSKTGVKSRIKLDHLPDEKTGVLKATGRTIQTDALDALSRVSGGTLQLACGRGKTVVALEKIARDQVPTIIVVDNTQLLKQWQDEIARHLVVPSGVGLIQGTYLDWKKAVVMATYQTLANRADTMPEEIRRWFGLIIWDEGHHVNAPTFSKSAPLFYGYRLALTATPERSDGLHVVCHYHVGKVVFKDVTQDLIPSIHFQWTGLCLDFTDPDVCQQVNDKNGELHLGKLAGYFGRWRHRLTKVVINEVAKAVGEGRKILVLSNSVDEVINLMTLWTAQDDNAFLYTDIPIPTQADVGGKYPPLEMPLAKRRKSEKLLGAIRANLNNNSSLNPLKRRQYEERAKQLHIELEQDKVHLAVQRELRKRQKKFVQDLLAKPSTSGLFTEIVPPDERTRMLKTRQVVFAIMKYGKEGLDDKDLDTVIISEPISDKNTIQQIMGRPSRPKSGKQPLLVFLEDDVPALISQCRTIRHHLKTWPIDEGGPFKYDLLGHPSMKRRRTWKMNLTVPGL